MKFALNAIALAAIITLLNGCSEQDPGQQQNTTQAATTDSWQEPAPWLDVSVHRDPLKQAYFGELHVHTMNSPDAFMLNVRNTPRDAYRFARGEAIEHATGARLQLSQPLDFIAVTDHSEYMGILPRMLDPDSELGKLALARQLRSDNPEQSQPALLEILMTMGAGKPLPELVDPKLRHAIWQEYVRVADQFYQPGEFTTLVGYEWTSSGAMSGINLHRNVLFRGNEVPAQPFSSFDSVEPRQLWTWMDQQREQGIESMAIPHNSNLSDGLMFPATEALGGEPLDAGYAELRQRNEPLAEIAQIKGTSETHPLLSPNDEWASFEILEDLLGGTGTVGKAAGSYIRDAWLTGLLLEENQGFNPYRFGVIAATDSHNAASQAEEDNYHGKIGTADGTPESRRKGSFINKQHIKYSASGLAGVWAESNTREDIYDALARREAFGTTGPRIGVRFFGGWNWPDDVLEHHDWVMRAYQDGVPMGSELPIASSPEQAPAFLVWAAKDPASAWLQRIQIIKGWVEDGEKREQVYDVACADGLRPDPDTHRCPDNGAGVDLATCDFDREKGDVQLGTAWRDPDFSASQRAFYYVRVLENPTCRWSTWDSLRNRLPLSPDVPPTLQERAYTSPIWYRPHQG
ncbi:hypothetical protein CWI75_07500 [Kineobactrum sediminis]|uniref:DUF3604 domain-containing protein n=1 Tax=Kineobactrum sediminis TaxID=1905677 RepID=A0A2N5Y4C5_9GAMM|nr:DUF3604 domain-containing protein [Kineobactrum sediminis]PLW83244.1 hypothetical protein CWI75_07500 [Kineobactrum sediminis]